MSMQPLHPGTVPTWGQGDYLRKAREYAGLTVKELAARAGISEKTINNYEGDRVRPRRPSLIAWSFATGVDLDWLTMKKPHPDDPDGDDGRARRDSNPQPSDLESDGSVEDNVRYLANYQQSAA